MFGSSTNWPVSTRRSRLALGFGLIASLLSVALAASAPELRAAEAAAEPPPLVEAATTWLDEVDLVLTTDPTTTELLDTRGGNVTTLADVVAGDRAVLLWYWAPG